MNVLFDSTPLKTGHKGRGIGVYTKNLLRYLKKIPDVRLHRYIKNNTDLIHYPYFDLFFHTLPIYKKTRTVVTIHDTIPLIYPDRYKPGVKGWIRLQLQKIAIKRVDAVITDSQSSKKDIQKHLSISEDKIFSIPLSVSDDFTDALKKSSGKRISPNPYLLYVGDINYNKNIPALVKAISGIQNKRLELVIVSRALKNKNIPESKKIYQAIDDNRLQNRIKILTDVSTSQLVTYYSQALWYIQPSLYEGFGLPILEAFKAGTPVICSNSSSLPEVAGEGVVYFDPKKASSISKGIDKALSLKKDKIKSMKVLNQKQLKKFSWESTASQTREVYRKVLEVNE